VMPENEKEVRSISVVHDPSSLICDYVRCINNNIVNRPKFKKPKRQRNTKSSETPEVKIKTSRQQDRSRGSNMFPLFIFTLMIYESRRFAFEFKEKNPKLTLEELMKTASEMWKRMDDSEKLVGSLLSCSNSSWRIRLDVILFSRLMHNSMRKNGKLGRRRRIGVWHWLGDGREFYQRTRGMSLLLTPGSHFDRDQRPCTFTSFADFISLRETPCSVYVQLVRRPGSNGGTCPPRRKK
jgi:hypothetical protein